MLEADRDKLVKILRMFSSYHDGEVVTAARMAYKLLKDRALDWDDLIISVYRPERAGGKAAEQESDEVKLIHRCAELHHALTPWEREFISSIRNSIIEWGRLTTKQQDVLNRIVNKLKVNGLWEKT